MEARRQANTPRHLTSRTPIREFEYTVSSHDLNLQNNNNVMELRVSNPRTIDYVQFSVPFASSNPQGLGSFLFELLKSGRTTYLLYVLCVAV